jgi:hypothetical protein
MIVRPILVVVFALAAVPPHLCVGDVVDLSQRVGPYSGLRSLADVQQAVRDGFNLTVQSTSDPVVLKSMREQGMKYIDIKLWSLVNAYCRAQAVEQKARGETRSCVISAAAQQTLLGQATRHLDEVRNDPGIAAFWILDDYPWGDISSTLEQLHALIVKSTEGRKPSVCGIGGSLDHRTANDRRFEPDREYTTRALDNLTPAACDVIAPYFYGSATANDPRWIDWTMGSLMPWFIDELRQRGFGEPQLLPVLHAFSAARTPGGTYYVHPRPEDIEAQAKAYCDSGAIGLLFFTWQARDALNGYENDAQIRAGVTKAVANCRPRLQS